MTSDRPPCLNGVPCASLEYHWVQTMYAEKVGLEDALPLLLHPMFSDVVILAVGE